MLLAQRPPGKHLAGHWEFPGGKVEPGESSRAALARELTEEIGIAVETASPLIAVPWTYAEKRIVLDAWEIANRNNLFAPVSHKGLPFIANSDFHKPKHIYSWKTMLFCEKHPEAIIECVRNNQHVSITLYRDGARSLSDAMVEAHPAGQSGESEPLQLHPSAARELVAATH